MDDQLILTCPQGTKSKINYEAFNALDEFSWLQYHTSTASWATCNHTGNARLAGQSIHWRQEGSRGLDDGG